ncbi:MAG: hypothetical protein WCO13_08485 [Bacteroidota bacterium]
MNRFLFFLLILLSSCTTIESLSSISESTETKSDYRFYNAENKIRYQITNDNTYLKIRLNTIDASTIMKILRTGFNFYFDVNGKKDLKVYFQYPQARNFQSANFPEQHTAFNGKPREFDLKSSLVQAGKMGVFVKQDKTEQISVFSSDAEIKVKIETINNSEITYELTIPFSKISSNGIASLANLSIGIVSGKMDMHPKGEPKSSDSMDGETSSGMQGGGNPDGMQGNGRSGGMHQGGMQGGGRREGIYNSAMNAAIEFWFKVELTK